MIRVEDWAEIRRLHRAEQMPIRAIARHLGISKNTVKRALASDRPPKYERPAKGSVVDAVEVQIRELLRDTPTMPATVIAERIGWERGVTVLKERVRELRPAYVPVDPVSRTTYQPVRSPASPSRDRYKGSNRNGQRGIPDEGEPPGLGRCTARAQHHAR